ncbi:MAG: LicD family protein [Treponema sp.]|nr:LicD family protein [Treponema sp.]
MEQNNNTSENQVEKIHKCLLIIAKEIKRICDANNIHYFMLAGTLLGSIRHKGFIPWDDDMDIGMLRKDYNRFLEVCETQLDKEHFFVQRIETDDGFGKFYTRLLLKDTYLEYDYIKYTSSHKAIFVDIFPYDSIPSSKLLQKKQSVIVNFALRLLKKKLGYGVQYFTLGGKIEVLFTPFFKKQTLINIYNKEMQKYNYDENSEYINSANAGYGYFKEILKRKWCLETEEMVFEDMTMPGSIHYDEYLKHLYGDYMQIPPKDQQITHEFKNIDFGPYDNL